MFEEIIEWNCNNYNIEGTEIAKDVEWIRKTMAEAADMSVVRVRKAMKRKQAHWWNENIAELRRKCNTSRRKWTKAKSDRKKRADKGRLDEVNREEMVRLEKQYKENKKDLVLAIFHAKEESWKSLIREIDRDPWGIPYKLVINRLRFSSPGLTEVLEEDTLKEVIFKLFPRETEVEEDGEVVVDKWKDEWDVSFVETNRTVRRKGARNTAPGVDGINNKMWKKSPNMINKVAEIYTKCMRAGEFPAQWKRAKLVLIPKGKIEEQKVRKARPICLIDDVGKGLERVIVERIERWTDEMVSKGLHFSAVANNQYGFRRNKSTIDALTRVKERVVEARKDGNVAMIISLDIENAFNSIPWKEIKRMMRRKRFPYYLKILNSYFENRSVEYVNATGKIIQTKVERGVPQGSVLGPLIWNLVYDRVLKVKKEKGCELIGYTADDTLIVSVADTYDEAKYNASMQVERTICAIRNIGLRVAVEKTEAMIFYGKKGRRPPNDDYFILEGKKIAIGKKLKYLGMILDSKLSFAEHFRYIQEKVEKVKRALCRLMPNLRGPHESKRRLYAYVVQSIVMYGAPIWYDSFVKNTAIQRPLRKIQRQLAIRIISGYKTIAYEVAIILARTPPWVLVARKYKRIYERFRKLKERNEWTEILKKQLEKKKKRRC